MHIEQISTRKTTFFLKLAFGTLCDTYPFMQRHITLILIATVSLLLFAGCAHYPLNMSEDEWHRLSPQQQYEARQQQAVLDAQAAERREKARLEQEAREAEQARLQHERDIANGMTSRFETICIGGSRCPGDDKKSHVFGLGQFTFVDKITFHAHDSVGKKHNATIAVYADQHLVADSIDIKRRGKDHTIFVGAVARNIVIKVRNDDEVYIENLKVFGERLDARNAHILIKQAKPSQPK